MKELGFDSRAVHSGESKPLKDGAIVLPIYQSSTYEYVGEDDYDLIRYARLSNTPNHLALAGKISELEGTQDALVTASGMAAITTALLTVIPHGGHLLAQQSLYGGTLQFLKDDFEDLGRTVSFFTDDQIPDLERIAPETTAAVYCETITNPLLRVADLRGLARVASKCGWVSLIDNTFASPLNCNPVSFGFDLVLHSATKYLNGHSDIIAGAVAGKKDVIRRIRHKLNHLGGSLDTHACFLLQRGLKTLGLRVRQHNQSAMDLAESLSSHPRVSRVIYPGLKSHPDHARASEILNGFGGMLSIEVDGSPEQIDRCLSRLKLAVIAPSLGGVETLVTRPVTTSHRGIDPKFLSEIGLSEKLVRISVGLESSQDLVNDFRNTLQEL